MSNNEALPRTGDMFEDDIDNAGRDTVSSQMAALALGISFATLQIYRLNTRLTGRNNVDDRDLDLRAVETIAAHLIKDGAPVQKTLDSVWHPGAARSNNH